jgi:putative transposase
MTTNSTKSPTLQLVAETMVRLLDDWFDPIEAGLRGRVREFIQAMIEGELEAALSRPRYGRRPKADPENADGPSGISGHRHGHRSRSLLGTFGPVEIAVPRARLDTAEGKTSEWKSTALRAYQRRTKQADSLIAGAYLAGTNTRRVRRALGAVFGGAISKDTVSRVWRKVKADWDAWNSRSLADQPIIRLILDGTVVRVRLDRKATSIVLLVVLGVREDGQKVLLAVKNMGGETSEAWRVVLDDLVKRGLRKPEFLIVDGGTGLEQALAALWGDVPTQRCTVHKHRNLLAHAPKRLHEEVSADYTDMIYAASPAEIAERRRAFIRKWRLKCKAVADSLEEAGDRLFTFTRLPDSQWKSVRTTNAIEQSAGSRPRRCSLQPRPQPCCSGHYSRLVRSPCAKSTDGKLSPRSLLTSRLTSLPDPISSSNRRPRQTNSNTHRDGTMADVQHPLEIES